MARGGWNGPTAALTGLSPRWAALVAGGGLGLVLVLLFRYLGLPLALMLGGLPGLFVGITALRGGRRAWARSPSLNGLPYRARRHVMGSVLHGRRNFDPALAPAVEEQAHSVLERQHANRRVLVLLSIACALQVLGVVVGALEGDSPRLAQVWPLALFAASLPVAWHREARRLALAQAAEDAARRARA